MTKPEKIEKTHGVPVATIHFRSYELPLLELFVYFVQHAASALGIPASGVAMLPRRRQRLRFGISCEICIPRFAAMVSLMDR